MTRECGHEFAPLGGGGDSCLWEFTRICHYSCFRSSCSKIRCDFGFIMSSLREAFVSRLRVGVMEQASGSTMTGIRAFSAHLPLTSLLLFYYYSIITVVALYCFSALRLLYTIYYGYIV